MTTPGGASTPSLRAATPDDIEAIATVWHRGWRDGHLGHVPDSLPPHRRLVDFRERVPPRVLNTTVATIASGVVGFVTVQDDEVEQIYVAESARGGDIANLLLRYAEQRIAVRFDTAWLAVVAGNTRGGSMSATAGATPEASTMPPRSAGEPSPSRPDATRSS